MVILNQGQKPVLVADIKNDKWADSADKRWIADIHTRQRYDQMLAECPIPELYGLSLLGTSLRVYRGVKATGVVVLRAVGFRHLVSGRIQPDEANCYVYQGASWPLSEVEDSLCH
ncbi:hypothetical protein F5J12DRAFT_862101 [Pisolithus orientalis]|uniref:uncharacterized protein n=1 Tax=Pisolithus orientalis TaxID=936130 RepID=UPI0022255DFB|nr:uncharacterized protein F5J12DRAFT_862101 [Pisolithus orientalis]KAI5990834.1 hypothetical protein F5J12DRAFT_862101 [Pisolithus orientalis]